MDLLRSVMTCLTGQEDTQTYDRLPKENVIPYTDMTDTDVPYAKSVHEAAEDTAEEIISLLLGAEKITADLNLKIHRTITTRPQQINVSSSWWAKRVAKAVFDSLLKTVKEIEEKGGQLVGAMGEAFTAAREWANTFAHDHPVVTAVLVVIVVLAILAILTPYILELLGFVAEGPLAGKFYHFFAHGSRASLSTVNKSANQPLVSRLAIQAVAIPAKAVESF